MTSKPLQDQIARDKALLWRAGKISWKLHSSQKLAYKQYREWEAFALAERKAARKLPGLFPRIFQFDVSRRWGKDFLNLLIRIEDAIRNPGGHYSYGTAYQRDIAGIVVPLFHLIIEDCPLDIKPEYRQSFQGAESGIHFKNGSIIKLVGVDKNADGLRGRFSDGVTLSEGAFIDRLEYCVLSVLMPQLQGRQHATIVINSTPPEAPGTWYDDTLTLDCSENGRYVRRTIFDNPMLSEAERDEFILAAGGLDNPRCRREYLVERIRAEDTVVLPEFSVEKHVRSSEMPKHAMGWTILDPGVRDMCAIAVGYYDFARAKLVFKRSWAKRGANTEEVVKAIKELEESVFGKDGCKLRFWNGREMANNPAQRFSDCEARLLLDLSALYKIRVAAADKVDAEAALNALRAALQNDKIEIDPEAKELILHMRAATWNKQRTSYARSEILGHADLVDVAKYAWRMTNPSFRMNPSPPAGHAFVMAGGNQYSRLWNPSDWAHGNDIRSKIAKMLPQRKKSHTS